MSHKQCDGEKTDGKELSLVWAEEIARGKGRPRCSDHGGLKDHRESQREYSAKPEVKDKIKAKQKEHRLRVSKIIFVCVFVCDFECRGKKHREHSKFLLLQKRKKRENVSHEWSLLQIQ